MPRHRGSRADAPINADINVTSLVDVAFTLLVIFIITAPVLQGGLDVNLPDVRAPAIDFEEDPPLISIDQAGAIYLDEIPVDLRSLPARLRALLAPRRGKQVLIEADEVGPSGVLVQVMKTIMDSGGRIALMTEPPDESG